MQVGTVLNIKDAKNAVKAGAKFLMSPTMVKVCIERGPARLLLLMYCSELQIYKLKPHFFHVLLLS